MFTWSAKSMSVLLGQATGGSGEGLQYSLEPNWSFAAWAVRGLGMLVVAGVVLLYLHERGGARTPARLALTAIRLALIVMVFVMLLGWMLHRDRTDLPDIVVVIDDSQSMLLEDHYGNESLRAQLSQRLKAADLNNTTRINLAKLLLLENDGALLGQLRDKYNLKIYRVGGSARTEAEADDSLADSIRRLAAAQTASRLGKCLRDVLEAQRGRPTAAVILLTDGVTTEGKTLGEVAQYARRKSVPLFAVGLGSDQAPRDVRIGDVLVDDVVFVGDVVNFDAKLSASGYEGRQVAVRLKEEGKSRVLAEERLTLGSDGQQKPLRLSYRAEEKGEFRFVVEVESPGDEVNTENNRAVRPVNVRDETIRVLLVQSTPSFEFRFLKSLLTREMKGNAAGPKKSIELTTLLQEADEQLVEGDPSSLRVFPVRRDKLFEFDVIIFGDVNPAGLGRVEMSNIADFVKVRGGGLVVIAGPRFTPLEYRETPLADLLPVDLTTAALPERNAVMKDKYSPQPTALGMSSQQMQLGDSAGESRQIWQQLEGLHWLMATPDVKSAARVLAVHPTRTGSNGRPLPVISMQFVGAGKVIFHGTDETHRWRFRRGDRYFARYWIQTLRYLSRSKLLGASRSAEMTSDREEYRRGETVYLRVRFFDDRLAPAQDDGVTIVLEREQGNRRNVKLSRKASERGVFEGTLTNLAEGKYRAWVATPVLDGKPPSQRFAVVAPPGEQARLEMDSADLKLAAKVSQGKFYTIDRADSLIGDLPEGRQVRIASLPPTSIWSWPRVRLGFIDLPLVALIFGGVFVVLIAAEWILRKRLGML